MYNWQRAGLLHHVYKAWLDTWSWSITNKAENEGSRCLQLLLSTAYCANYGVNSTLGMHDAHIRIQEATFIDCDDDWGQRTYIFHFRIQLQADMQQTWLSQRKCMAYGVIHHPTEMFIGLCIFMSQCRSLTFYHAMHVYSAVLLNLR